jgi:hypothetical protein
VRGHGVLFSLGVSLFLWGNGPVSVRVPFRRCAAALVPPATGRGVGRRTVGAVPPSAAPVGGRLRGRRLFVGGRGASQQEVPGPSVGGAGAAGGGSATARNAHPGVASCRSRPSSCPPVSRTSPTPLSPSSTSRSARSGSPLSPRSSPATCAR